MSKPYPYPGESSLPYRVPAPPPWDNNGLPRPFRDGGRGGEDSNEGELVAHNPRSDTAPCGLILAKTAG